MNGFLVALTALFAVQFTSAQIDNDFERWSIQAGSTGFDKKLGVCTNKNTNLSYFVGRGGTDNDVEITVTNSYGDVVNSRAINTAGATEFAFGCKIDSTGSLIIVGQTDANTFEGETNPHTGSDVGVIAKIDGTTLATTWIKLITNDGTTAIEQAVSAVDVFVDSSDNYYVGGTTGAGFDGVSTILSTGHEDNVFWAKFDTSGTRLYAKIVLHAYGTRGRCVVVDETSDTLYLAGTANGPLYGTAPTGSRRGVVNQITASTGAIVSGWDVTDGDTDWAYGCGLTTDNKLMVVGAQYNSVSSGPNGAYVVKYSSGSTEEWRRNFGNTFFDTARAIAIDSASNSYVVGGTRQTTFEGVAIAGAVGGTTISMYFAKLDPAGTTTYAVGYSSGAGDEAFAVSLDSDDNAVIAGFASGAVGSHSFSGGSSDYFMFSWGDPMPTQAPTAAPTCQTITVESAHPYARDTLQSWNVEEPSFGGCYKITFDPLSWTPEKYDFVRLYSVTGGISTQLPTADRLYRNRLADYGTQEVFGDSVDIQFYSDYVNPSYLRRYPWTDKSANSYGFKVDITCCDA